MKDTWGREVPEHKPEDCFPCRGSGFYSTPVGGNPDDPDGYDDEDNCYCDCHGWIVSDG